jgi:AraC-like DNA-binding protein/ABC-type glycerol-3-phosphate transport system substrate-binding protein
MKLQPKEELYAHCIHIEEFRKHIPEIKWVSEARGMRKLPSLMEEMMRSSSSLCFASVNLRDLPVLHRNHALLCLEDYWNRTERSPYFQPALDVCKIDGKLMAIPEDITPFVLFSRKDLLEKYDLQPAKDSSELLQQLELLKRKTGKAMLQVPSGGISTRLGFLTALIGAFGINLNDSLEAWADHYVQLIRAFDWVQQLHKNGLISDLDLYVRQMAPRSEEDHARFKFLHGEIIYYPAWLVKMQPRAREKKWAPDNFWTRDYKNQIDLTLFPPASADQETCQPFRGRAWIISANFKEPDVAVKILKKIQMPILTKKREMSNGWPFLAWKELWTDPDIIKKYPLYQWGHVLENITRSCAISQAHRKFELLDQSFRQAIRENLDGGAWVQMLLAREFTAARKITTDRVIQKAVQYMEENLETIRNARQVAAHLKLSTSYFNRIFLKKMRVGCSDYLMRVRMEKANQQLLERKLSIKEIALSLGFKHASAFTRAFRKYSGKSPSELTRVT